MRRPKTMREPGARPPMSEWLDVMLEEIERKREESREAEEESERRAADGEPADIPTQPK